MRSICKHLSERLLINKVNILLRFFKKRRSTQLTNGFENKNKNKKLKNTKQHPMFKRNI